MGGGGLWLFITGLWIVVNEIWWKQTVLKNKSPKENTKSVQSKHGHLQKLEVGSCVMEEWAHWKYAFFV